eukprot:scaffold5602_cov124-Isochrysis_galbana.AAC.1
MGLHKICFVHSLPSAVTPSEGWDKKSKGAANPSEVRGAASQVGGSTKEARRAVCDVLAAELPATGVRLHQGEAQGEQL